jgi:Uma2 family endonuclease
MTVVKNIADLDLNGVYSYADYLLWQFEERVELIRGKIFKMSPAPSEKHQRVSSRLHGMIFNFFSDNQCRLYSAPFDVRLFDSKKSQKANKEVFTVIQPDLCVICDKSKIDERGAIGAPDLVVEILSLGNSKKEMKLKYELYEESGVQEYWVVYPYEEHLLQFVLNDKQKYVLHKIYQSDEIASSFIFPNLALDLEKVFAE